MTLMLNYPINVTIDTNAFFATKYDFSDNSPLDLLRNYVKNDKIKVVLSDIVIREAKNHISKQVSDVCGIARNLRTECLKTSTEHLITYVGLDRLLELTRNKKELMINGTKLFDDFINDINAEILHSDLIDLDKVIDDYFEINPPFQSGEKKRKEFPDAFIASQITKRFGENEKVAIISADNGFKDACKNTPNHMFFDSLSQLYDTINKEDVAYDATMHVIEELQYYITSKITDHIKNNENIDVKGKSYDKDGIEYGFDYNEYYLDSISNTSFKVHSVDELNEKTSVLTLLCNANISADCFYEDYDNAAWDSETKEYIFVDTVKIKEIHHARFGCRIELDRETKKIKIMPFTIILGGDSRVQRYEVEESDKDIDYEQEIEDMERESLGFTALGNYESYLEENLPNSDLYQSLVKQFDEINDIHRAFEDFSITYDSLLDKINESENPKDIIKKIIATIPENSDFPNVIDEECIEEFEIEEIKQWISSKSDKTFEISEECHLPDSINYGDSFLIKGVDSSELLLKIDEILISPSAGSEEIIEVQLSDEEEIIKGHIKLIIGYLDFDEDGGAANGLQEDIEYYCDEIIEKIDSFIASQTLIKEFESKAVESIESILEHC